MHAVEVRKEGVQVLEAKAHEAPVRKQAVHEAQALDRRFTRGASSSLMQSVCLRRAKTYQLETRQLKRTSPKLVRVTVTTFHWITNYWPVQ